MIKVQNKLSRNLDSLMKPQSVAVIGASGDPNKISGRPIEYLLRNNYGGNIYPVNPNREQIQGIPAYPSLSNLPDEIDLVVIAIAAKHVIKVLEECVSKNIKSCMIFSSGFAELGDEGGEIQKQISEIAKKTHLNIVGPNCQGLANLKDSNVVTFSTAFAEGELEHGSSAILSQSGAVASMIYNMQKDDGVGIKYWASTGNEADINVNTLLNYVLEDPDVNLAQVYMEDIKDSQELLDAAKKAEQLEKPILVLKSGTSDIGQKAASSHTGALAAEDAVIDKVFSHHGIIRVKDVNELSSFSKVFKLDKKAKGRNVAIISNSGGLGVMLADSCIENGLNISEFTEETKQKLSQALPIFASFENPVDVTAQLLNDKDLLKNVLPILLDDPNIDQIIFGMGIIGKGYDIPSIIKEISNAQENGEKLISVAWVGSQKGVTEQFNRDNIPAFEDPTLLVKALSKYTNYSMKKNKGHTTSTTVEIEGLEQINTINIDTHKGFLSEYDSKRVISDYLQIENNIIVNSENDIEENQKKLNYPVVMKLNSPEIQHKSEVGGVKLNINSQEELVNSFNEMKSKPVVNSLNKEPDFLIEEMSSPGFEISLGMKKDPIFGPAIMVASGGVYIEILKDYQLLIPPVTYEDALEAVNALKLSPLLYGTRGQNQKDVEKLCDVIINFSKLIEINSEVLEEIDLNPVIVKDQGKGVTIADALIKLSDN